ncbi:acetyltransferase [Shewanella algae]|uniref:Acetyltransferase n=1 Tax=bacterium 19CA01SA08 TaxID=2920574 RepID=A0AAU6VYR7_UNCXX
MKRCAIFGAGGHGKVVAELAELNGYQNVVFFDDNWPKLKSVEHWPVVGCYDSLLSTAKNYLLTVIAIGDNRARLKIQNKLLLSGACFGVLVHPSASVSRYASLGIGTVVMANAVVNPFATVGCACIINTSATVDHDSNLADGVHISPGANLAGAVFVGKRSWIGIGSQVKQRVEIGDDVTVGAGSTVINNIPELQIVVGSPAKPIAG